MKFVSHQPRPPHVERWYGKWLIDRMDVYWVYEQPDGVWMDAEVYVCPGCVAWQVEVWFSQFGNHCNFWAAEEAADEHLRECRSFAVVDALVRYPE